MKQIPLKQLQRLWAYHTLKFKIAILEKILLDSYGEKMWNKIAKELNYKIAKKKI